MTKKANTTVKIKTSSAEDAQLLLNLIAGGTELQQSVKRILANQGKGNTDPVFEDVDMDKLTAVLKLIPENKGQVLVVGENAQTIFTDYSAVGNKEIYVELKAGKAVLYRKIEGGLDEGIGMAPSFTGLGELMQEINIELNPKQ